MTMRRQWERSPAQYLATSSLTTAAAFYINDEVLNHSTMNDGVYAARRPMWIMINLAVGYVTKNVSGLTKTKFFVHEY